MRGGARLYTDFTEGLHKPHSARRAPCGTLTVLAYKKLTQSGEEFYLKLTDVFSLLGGLALFLYGMQMMSGGLEAAAGNRMKQILEKLTANRFLGVAVGTVITMLIQSSSATTVMVVGFINSGMMTLQQAVGIIMGANIGTTVAGQLIALDIGALAPLFAFAGVVLVVFVKSPKAHHWGQILAGLGVLFIGMDMMSASMMPLRESEAFVSLMTRFSNPLIGILAGAVFTAVIQSSSASVGILQTLAAGGLINLSGAAYVLFGQNIGTCITAVLASIGTSRSAKRATIIHLMFNIIGTVLFTALCMATPLTDIIASFTPDKPASQIANLHTLFNIVTTILLIPFGTYLAALSRRILPELPSETEQEHRLEFLPQGPASRETRIGSSAILLNGVSRELRRMMGMVTDNVRRSFDAVLDPRRRDMAGIEACEEYIDFLNKELAAHIARGIATETNEQDSARISAYFKIASDLERIGDHAMNIGGYTDRMEERHIKLSQTELDEIGKMRDVSLEAMQLLADDKCSPEDRLVKASALEQKIDDMTEQFRRNQLERMKDTDGADEMSVLYSEMLTDFERIGDHALNIAQALMPRAFART